MNSPAPNRSTPAVWSLRTADPDEFAERIRPVACTLSILTEGKKGFCGDLTAVRLARTSIFTVGFSRTRVVDDNQRSFLSLTIPVSGSARIRSGQHVHEFSPGSAAIIRHDDILDYRVTERPCKSLVVNFDQVFVEAFLGGHERLQFPAKGSTASISDRSASGRTLLQLAHFVWRGAGHGAFIDPSSLASREMEKTLLAAFFDATSQAPARDHCQSAQLRRAIDYLMDHLADPVSLVDVASYAGVSERSLRREFQRNYGMTVRQFLIRRRLEASHHALQSKEGSGTTVTEVATRFGFSHLGRFASAYRSTFGCSPSDSLKS